MYLFFSILASSIFGFVVGVKVSGNRSEESIKDLVDLMRIDGVIGW